MSGCALVGSGRLSGDDGDNNVDGDASVVTSNAEPVPANDKFSNLLRAAEDAASTTAEDVISPETKLKFGPQKRRGGVMFRKCANCAQLFRPLSRASKNGFADSDKFCSIRCQSSLLEQDPELLPRQDASVNSVYKRVQRQVGILSARNVESIFAARTRGSDKCDRIVVAAADKDTATIMQFLLSGRVASMPWAVPLKALFADSIRTGVEKGFMNYFGHFVSSELCFSCCECD